MTQITFNKRARTERIEDQTNSVIDKIKQHWEDGISPVDLEVDTDIFRDVKALLKSSLEGFGYAKVTSKGLSLQKKNNKTLFRVINLNI